MTNHRIIAGVTVSLLWSVLFSRGLTGPLRAEEQERLQIAEIVNQVKLAFLDAEARAPKNTALPLKDIVLTLQGVTSKEAGGKMPLLFFTAGAKINKKNIQTVSITLKPESIPPSEKRQAVVASALADAILSIHYAVGMGKPQYKFSNGYVEIQCGVTKDVNVGLVLKPLEANVDYSEGLVQTVKINYEQ